MLHYLGLSGLREKYLLSTQRLGQAFEATAGQALAHTVQSAGHTVDRQNVYRADARIEVYKKN